jgi:hypothetical protein
MVWTGLIWLSENLAALRIEPGTSGSVIRNCDHWTTGAVDDNDDNNNNMP